MLSRPDVHNRAFHLLIAAELSELARVRRLMEEVAAAASLPAERAFDLKVTVSEAAANAIEHASSEVEIVARILPDRLTVEVTSGGGFRAEFRRDGELRPRGLGLPLMVSFADQVLVSRLSQGKIEVLLTFLLGPQEWATEPSVVRSRGRRRRAQASPPSVPLAPTSPEPPTSPPPIPTSSAPAPHDFRSRVAWNGWSFVGRWAWLLLPAFFVAVVVLAVLQPEAVYGPTYLFTGLSLVFLTATSLVVAFISARSFLDGQSDGVLLVGAGALMLGLGAALAAMHAGGSGEDLVPAIYNVSALLAGVCHFMGAVVSVREGPVRVVARRRLLSVAYVGVAAFLALLVSLVRIDLWPATFAQGAGMTKFGFAVTWGAAGIFAMAAVLLKLRPPDRPPGFNRWYVSGLALLAIGLAGLSLQLSLGASINWVGRAAQYLGGVCILVAVLSWAKETGSWMLPLRRALLESEGRYRSLVELSPDAILVHADGQFVFANQAAAGVFGVETPEQVVGKSALGFVHPNDRAAVLRRMEQAYSGVATPPKELTIIRGDGSYIDVEFTGARVMLAGKPALQMVMRDAGARRHAVQELQAGRRRAEFMAHTAGNLLAASDPQALIEDLCRQVMDELDCEVFLSFLVDEERGQLRLSAYHGIDREEADTIEWLDRATSICGCVADSAAQLVAEDIANSLDPRTEVVRSLGLQAYACQPLVHNEVLLGTLSFGTRARSHFSETDLMIMRTVSDQVAVALACARSERAMAETGRTLARAQTVARTGSWWFDISQDRLLWSQETYRIFGLRPGGPLTYQTFLSRVHPDDLELVVVRPPSQYVLEC